MCRAAYVTDPGGDGTLSLMVANPTGLFFSQDIQFGSGAGSPGDPECLSRVNHGNPFRYCECGWTEPHYQGGTWHHAAHA